MIVSWWCQLTLLLPKFCAALLSLLYTVVQQAHKISGFKFTNNVAVLILSWYTKCILHTKRENLLASASVGTNAETSSRPKWGFLSHFQWLLQYRLLGGLKTFVWCCWTRFLIASRVNLHSTYLHSCEPARWQILTKCQNHFQLLNSSFDQSTWYNL